MAGYVHPSACELCVPTETLVSDGYIVQVTELAHEAECGNRADKAGR